LNKWKKCI